MPKINDYPRKRFIVRNDKLYLRTTFAVGVKSEKCLGLNADGFDTKKQKFVKNRALNDTLKEILKQSEDAPKQEEVKTFDKLVWDYIESHELSRQTEEIWMSFLKKIKKCFTSVDEFDCKTFVDFMLKDGLGESTITMYLGHCNALKFDVPIKYKKMYRTQQREIWLDDGQIKTLLKFLITFTDEYDAAEVFKSNGHVCALWVYYLCYLTALAPIDLVKLQRTQITETEKCWFINGKRQKTKMRYKIPIIKNNTNKKVFGTILRMNEGHMYFLPIMNGIEGKEAKIANRLSNKCKLFVKSLRKFIDETVNPFIEMYNKRHEQHTPKDFIKPICGLNKPIDKIETDKLTYYTARHSMIMHLLNSNVPPAQLALMLGRNISTIQQYFHTLKDEQMDELSKALNTTLF